MNKQIEALKMAIEALDTLMMEKGSIYQQALKACKEALAEAEKLAWQSLSDDEIEYLECLKAPPVHPDFVNDDSWYEFARAIEAKLKEKNHG